MRLIAIISLLSLFSFNSTAQNYKTIDKIIAQVGDKVVLLSDLEQQKVQARINEMNITRELECQILEEMLYSRLLLNQALLDSVEISDAMVDAEMENNLRVIEQQIGGKENFEKFYGKSYSQIKEEFRGRMREKLLSQEMERQITADISVTPKEVEDFYNSLPVDSLPFINSKLGFQQIVIYPEISQVDRNREFEFLDKLRLEIIEGKTTFSSAAILHSEDPGSASNGGYYEATRGMMVPQFEATAFSLKPGEVSEVFETDFGYHIMQLIERKGNDYTCRHILRVAKSSSQSKIAAAYRIDSCYQELFNKKISWEDAVLKYSNDENTKFNNGIIMNPYTGETVWSVENLNQIDPQIFSVTDRMKEGEFSKPGIYDKNPINQTEGYRIIRLVSRTAPHRANLNQDYTLIKSATEQDKKQKVMTAWIDSKIPNAYIKIDPDFINCSFQNNWLRK